MAKAITVKGGGTVPFTALSRDQRDRLVAEISRRLIPIGKTPLDGSPGEVERALQISGDNLEKLATIFELDTMPPEARGPKWKAVAMRLAQLRWPDHFHVRETRWPGRPAKDAIQKRNREIVAAVKKKLAEKPDWSVASAVTIVRKKLPAASGLSQKTVENIYSSAKK